MSRPRKGHLDPRAKVRHRTGMTSPAKRDPQAILATLLDAAGKAGADAADALEFEGVSSGVSYRLGKLEDVERSESSDLGLRVFVGRKVAFVSSTDFSADALASLPDRAVAMARLAPEDKFAGLAPKDRLATDVPDLDRRPAQSPPTVPWSSGRAARKPRALAVQGITNSEGGGAAYGRSTVTLATAEGFFGGYAGDQPQPRRRGHRRRRHRHGARLRSRTARVSRQIWSAEDIGKRAAESAVKRLNPRKVKSQSVPVVFRSREAAGLVGHFAGAISGAAIARGVSFLKDRMGEPVFAARHHRHRRSAPACAA